MKKKAHNVMQHFWSVTQKEIGKKWRNRGLNPGPFACKANVIATTPFPH